MNANRIISKLIRNKERGLFVDLGSNLGQGFEFFRRYFPLSHFDYVLVEPNPHCAEHLRSNIVSLHTGITLIEAAASSTEGNKKLYGLTEDERGPTSEGASILREHNSTFYASDPATAIGVNSFSFSKFLSEKAQLYKTIIIKMDIEGAEYEVLSNMIRTNACECITHLYIEFHSQYMTGLAKEHYESLEEKIKFELGIRNVAYTMWH